MIRKAVPDDIQGIMDLGIEALNISPYPNLVINRVKIYSMATECVSSANNFAWIVKEENEIVGAVCAIVHPIMFYDGSQASVVQFYCKSPGNGIKLLREFMSWVRGRHIIRMVCFTLEMRADPRIGKLLNRLGLNKELPVYLKIV